MRYAIWNNKGGVGKSFLSFVLGTEIANERKGDQVVLVDMCPQANLSEVVLGGNGAGAATLEKLLASPDRKTIGGYFDARISQPQKPTGAETTYLLKADEYNRHLPGNVWLLAGDPSLEIQAQVISDISGQLLPQDSWRNVHSWLLDLVNAAMGKLAPAKTRVFIDCNPSFSAYTELAMLAAERVIIPCSSDGSSARAIDNVGALLYGVGKSSYSDVSFSSRAAKFEMTLPKIHSVLNNRSTIYNKRASKAFAAMFDEIAKRTESLRAKAPRHFVGGNVNFRVVPDNPAVTIVCSHLGQPLYQIQSGQYQIHDERPKVNTQPLKGYKDAIADLLSTID